MGRDGAPCRIRILQWLHRVGCDESREFSDCSCFVILAFMKYRVVDAIQSRIVRAFLDLFLLRVQIAISIFFESVVVCATSHGRSRFC